MALESDTRTAARTAHHGGKGSARRFGAHFLEMTVAMMLGMPLGGMAGRALGFADAPEMRAVFMALGMSVSMVVWMRLRGHGWRASAEMTAAMVLPVLVLFPLLWAGAVSGKTVFSLSHVTMLPAMLVAMLYRRREYGW